MTNRQNLLGKKQYYYMRFTSSFKASYMFSHSILNIKLAHTQFIKFTLSPLMPFLAVLPPTEQGWFTQLPFFHIIFNKMPLKDIFLTLQVQKIKVGQSTSPMEDAYLLIKQKRKYSLRTCWCQLLAKSCCPICMANEVQQFPQVEDKVQR